MVAPGIQTIGGIDMAYCKLCIPGMRQIGFRLANPLPTYVACIPFVPTVATGYAATGFRKPIRCAAGRHLGIGIQSMCPRSSSAGSTVRAIVETYLYGCAPGRQLGIGIRTSNSEES